MKEVLISFFTNDAILSLIGTGLATAVALGIQYLIEKIQNNFFRKALQRVVPIAKEVFFTIEKDFAKSKLSDKHLKKAQLFNRKFNEQFAKVWNRKPKAGEISIAKDLVTSMIEDKKKR